MVVDNMDTRIRKIAKKAVIQGGHRARIIDYYYEMAKAFREEFTEDNRPTQDIFLAECHKEALGKID